MDVDQDYEEFTARLARCGGVDLRHYKRQQMQRRLTSLRDKRGFSTFTVYLEAALANPDVMAEMLDRVTINVSAFFRNPSRWDVLVQSVFPLLGEGDLRVWSAACSTGQEAYTLAMLLARYRRQMHLPILATDVDERALTYARMATYSLSEVASVPESLRSGSFRFESGQAVVSDALRALVLFERHDLCQDVFLRDFHLIVCRNVMIYLTNEAKEVLYSKFRESLILGGVLFVGSTEQLNRPEQFGFQQIHPFFYQRVR